MKDHSLFDKIISLRLYELTYRGKIDTWDYQWDFVCKINKGLSIIPKNNLITNIGFDKNATHTKYDRKELPRKSLKFPLKENKFVLANKNYSKEYKRFFGITFLLKGVNFLKRKMKN